MVGERVGGERRCKGRPVRVRDLKFFKYTVFVAKEQYSTRMNKFVCVYEMCVF